MLHGMWPVGARDRRRGGRRPGARPRAPRGSCCGPPRCPSPRAVAAALTPVGPTLYTRGRRGRLALAVLRRVGVAGLDELVRRGALAVLLARHRRRHVEAPAATPGPRSCSSRWPPRFAVYSQRTVPVAAAMIAPLARRRRCRTSSAVVRRSVGASACVVAGGAVVALVALAVAVPHTSADPPQQPPGWTRRCARCRRAPRCSTTGTRAAT